MLKSKDFLNKKISGKLYLSGGGDIQQTYDADKRIFSGINSILYIPLAYEGDLDDCIAFFEELLLLYDIPSYKVLKDLEKEVDLSNYDMVYIGGGNTFRLLKKIKNSSLFNKISDYIKNGGKVYGGSAGAIIFGKTIKTASLGKYADKNNVSLSDLEGYGLIDYDVCCHYDEDDSNNYEIKQYVNDNKMSVLALSEECVVCVDNLGIEKVGNLGCLKFFEKGL